MADNENKCEVPGCTQKATTTYDWRKMCDSHAQTARTLGDGTPTR